MNQTEVPTAPTHDGIALGYEPMDAIHLEFEALLARPKRASDAELSDRLADLEAHLRAHFDAEDRWMRETDFSAGACHMDEHAAILRSAVEVRRQVDAGNTAVGRAFVAELSRWFPGHADYLDSALAHWMCKRQFGGKPVVFHRRTRPHGEPLAG